MSIGDFLANDNLLAPQLSSPISTPWEIWILPIYYHIYKPFDQWALEAFWPMTVFWLLSCHLPSALLERYGYCPSIIIYIYINHLTNEHWRLFGQWQPFGSSAVLSHQHSLRDMYKNMCLFWQFHHLLSALAASPTALDLCFRSMCLGTLFIFGYFWRSFGCLNMTWLVHHCTCRKPEILFLNNSDNFLLLLF